MVLADTANLVVRMTLDDKVSASLRGIDTRLKGMSGGFAQMNRGVGQLGSGLATLGTRAAIAAGVGLAAVVGTAVSFEDAFAGVRKTVSGTVKELDSLEDQFRQLARTMPLSFEELSQIGETGGALGIATGDLLEFTRVVALIGVTTDVTSDQAATALGQLQNVLGLTADDFDNLGAALVDLGNKGASTESQILAIAQRSGSAASLIDLSADKTLGWASAVANLGIEVEAGGSALQKFFLDSLQNINNDDTLEVMADTAGTTARAFKQAFEKDASGALETFLTGLGSLDKAAQLAVLSALGFNDVRITRTLLGLAGNTDNLSASLDTAADGWEKNTALTAEAEKRFATTKSQIALVKNNLRDAAFVIGDELLPVVADLSRDFVEFVNKPEVQQGLRDFGKGAAATIREIIDSLRSADFTSTIALLKGAGDVAKGAFDAFRSLPPEVQSFALAALVANKASGGAVGQIASGLVNVVAGAARVLLGGIFQRGGSPATPMWVQSVGGVGGAPGVGGKAGGAVGSLATSFVGTTGVLAAGTGGVLALSDIVSGTESGVKSGFAAVSGGFPSLIARAITEVIGDPIGDLVAELTKPPPASPSPTFREIQQKGDPELLNGVADIDKSIRNETLVIQRNLAATLGTRANTLLLSDTTRRAVEGDGVRNSLLRTQRDILSTSSSRLTTIANKKTSFTANLYTTVSATYSVNQALSTQSTFRQIVQETGG